MNMDRLSALFRHRIFGFSAFFVLGLVGLTACTETEIVESPKTAFVAQTDESKIPDIVWTTRTLGRGFDYLGQVKSRAWTYDGAIQRLVDGGKQLGADAVVDIHYERIGFFDTMSAFAIKYK